MKTLQIFALSALCFFTNSLFSQTGPGGVGNTTGNSDVTLWLDANTINQTNNSRVSNWNDNSGYGNTALAPASTSPVFISNQINGYPKVHFNINNTEYLGVADDVSLKPNTISIFVVGNLTDRTDRWGAFVSKGTGDNWNKGYALYRDNGRESIGGYVSNWNSNNVTTAITYNTNQILNLNYGNSKVSLVVNEREEDASRQNGNTSNSNSELWLGWAGGAGGGHYLDGDIAETILLKRHVNDAERIIIHNYLSAKYNIPLADNDLFKQDDSDKGNFDHHVAGIGKTRGANSHADSQGTGIVRINNPSNLSNNSFLFWGEETKNATYNFSANATNYSEHLNSNWRVSKSGDLGTVDVMFDISAMNLSFWNGCKDLQLVIANNSNFTSPRVYPLSVAAGVAKTINVTFNDNDYFTIRYIDKIVWNGTRYFNGSLPNQAPNNTTDKCLKLLVKNGDKAILNQNAYVKDIELEIGAFLEIADGVELTVENGIINNGNIDLLGEAQLIQKHAGFNLNSGNGNLKIRQQGSTNLFNYNYWSSPVARNNNWQIGYLEQNNGAVTFNSAQNANPNTTPISLSSRWLYTYNASAALGYYGWNQINAGSPIKPGIGYTMKGSGSEASEETYVFSGQANSGNYTYSVEVGNDFLVGNPYASALNADQFIRDNLEVTNGTLYFYEQFESNNTHVTRAYQGGYATFNLLAGVAAVSQLENGGLTSKGAPTKNIAVGQGFYITIVQNGFLNFSNAQRVFAKESSVGPNGSIFYRQDDTNENSESDTRTKFWLNFTDPSGRSREIVLGYDDNASEGFDRGYDAIDYSEYSDNMVWYTPDNLLVIQGLKTLNLEDEMALSIKVANPGNYTIGLGRTLNFPDSTPIYLKDNQENRFYDLKTETASIAFEAGTINTRYSIVYQRDTLGVSSLENNSSVYVKFDKNNDTVQLYGIDNLNTVKGVYIYSVDGKQVHYSQRLDSNNINVSNCNGGIYILKLEMLSGAAQNIRFVKY